MPTADIEITTRDQQYLITVKSLRSRNFSKNLPFLILSENLPDGQVYREFPDGHIELQEVSTTGSEYVAKAIRVQKSQEADQVRAAYGLL
ncbi:MAG TPA: hypothetical protein VGN20_11855 [Mucilaginibacter sp.]|jgi:hypothetical protein